MPSEFLPDAAEFGEFLVDPLDGWSAAGGDRLGQCSGFFGEGGPIRDRGVELRAGVGEFRGEGFVGEVAVFAFRPRRDLGFRGGAVEGRRGDPGG